MSSSCRIRTTSAVPSRTFSARVRQQGEEAIIDSGDRDNLKPTLILDGRHSELKSSSVLGRKNADALNANGGRRGRDKQKHGRKVVETLKNRSTGSRLREMCFFHPAI